MLAFKVVERLLVTRVCMYRILVAENHRTYYTVRFNTIVLYDLISVSNTSDTFS